MSDAITLLMDDHESVDGLFVQLEALRPEDDAPAMVALVRQVIDSLSVHAAMEEEVFYPAIRGLLAEGESLAEHAVEEHQAVRELMRELLSMDAAEAGFVARLARLINEVRHHVNEEEHQILPRLRTVVGTSQLVELGKRLEDARAELTRQDPASLIGPAPAEPLQATDELVEDLFGVHHSATVPRQRRGTGARATASQKGHVVYRVAARDRGGWSVRVDGAKRASSNHDRKEDAMARGRELARGQSGRLIVYRQDGSIQQETEYAR
jgi:hemerythrin-like domain-containing protein